MAAVDVPIHRVSSTGEVQRLGRWRHDAHVLELERTGFPLLGPGEHHIEGELPWVFWDMCPSGYLGRRLSRLRPELRLAPQPNRWTAEECLRVLTTVGSDLPGNLLIGDLSVEHFHQWRFDEREVPAQLDEALREQMTGSEPSSLGGERPKFVGYRDDGSGFLVKFSPPTSTPLGQRWSDLLLMESHAATTLRGPLCLSASRSRILWAEDLRTWLDVDRFDRLANRGRRGATTLYWLAIGLYGEAQISAPEVMRRLFADGHVDAASVLACEQAHAFSAAIGNDDAHLGNYALIYDDDGRASLAPLYDVLPMALAPRNDELPDAYLKPIQINSVMRPAVEHLNRLATGDADISREFVERWRGLVGL